MLRAQSLLPNLPQETLEFACDLVLEQICNYCNLTVAPDGLLNTAALMVRGLVNSVQLQNENMQPAAKGVSRGDTSFSFATAAEQLAALAGSGGNVVPIPDGIPEDVVSFFDALGNATHTALMFDVIGEDVLITGAGPIGMMATAICRRNGARSVVVTDVNDYRLDMAKKMGATATVNVAHDKLESIFGPQHMVEGFDVGLEMSGSVAALNTMIDNMRNGGKIALLGIHPGNIEININKVIWNSLTLQGVYGRKMYETWYKMITMVEGGLDMTPMITHRFNYRDFDKGFEAMNSGRSGKVVLDWTK